MSEQGTKYDEGKSRVDLLDSEFMLGVGEVLKFGAKKYAAHNWRGGIAYSRLIASALRHLFSIMNGEDRDEESGLPHVHHLGCCVMFLSWMMTHRKDLDDRYKQGSKPGEMVKIGPGDFHCHIKTGITPNSWKVIDKDPF